jgi:TPR repeat protein
VSFISADARKMVMRYMESGMDSREDSEIYSLVQVAAEKGIAEMQYLLGYLYLNDEAKMRRWHERTHGGFMQPDDEYSYDKAKLHKAHEAVLWWRKAAAQGYEDAIKGLENLALDETYSDALAKKYN